VLVATCPCALSLATPAALAAATSALARRGVLVAHTDSLESLAKTREMLWDKTGTLTQGLVRIDATQPLAELPEAECLELAAGLERMSDHPVARAFLDASADTNAATDVEVHPGEGLEGVIAGRRLRVGTEAFVRRLAPQGNRPFFPVHDAATSQVFLGGADGLLAVFELSDQLRVEAADCVAAIRELGITSHVVSGDQAASVARIAERCGIEHFESRMTPQSKLDHLRELQRNGRIVAAVGDGINDAPLLRGADVAIAMGRGSALAQTSADLILVRDTLNEVPALVSLARRTQRTIRQNLAWAFSYNLLVLPLAALGYVPPWLAAIGMSLSSVVVVLNSMRLSRSPHRESGRRWAASELTGAT
jgi:Cu2+-exporting ATPase